jgi:type I restriction enzyme S subunit
MDAQQFLEEFGHIANARGGIPKLRELILALAVRGHLVSPGLDGRNASDSVRALIAERKIKESKTSFRILGGITQVPYEVPDNWLWLRLGQVVEVLDGLRCPVTKNNRKTGPYPYYGASGIVDSVADYIFDEPLVLVGEDGAKWGRGENSAFRISGKTWVNNHAHVLRPRREFLNDDFLVYSLVEMDLSPFITGMTVPKLNQTRLISIPLPVPPVEEQIRIVSKVDELMALCDKLEAQQQERRKLQNNLRQSTLQAVVTASSPHGLQTTWTRLADNFGQLFHAPEDVAQLRDLILDLAVHGLLVDQSDADEPIAEWLTGVTATKTVLTKQKLIAKQTALADLSEDEYPFLPPKGWTFVRLGQITNKIGSGSTPRGGREVYVKEGIPFLRSQNVWNDGLHMDDVACITSEEHERMSGTAVLGKDVLLNITGASLGRCALVPMEFGEANVSQHVTIIRPTDPQVREYLHLCILSPYTQSMIWGRQVGMAREGLSKKVLEQFEIPLPPIAEQHRIVARVAELMRFCDVLEQQLQSSNELAERFAAASVTSITGFATEQEEEPMKAPQTELIASVCLGTAPDIKAQAPLATILARHNGEMAAKDLWQRFGGEIDTFYAQLKTEVAHGWILEPAVAEMRERLTDTASA